MAKFQLINSFVSRVSVGSVLLLALLATASAVDTVIPSAFTSTEGNSSSSSLFQTGAASLQVYYSEAFLNAAGIFPGASLSGIAFRRNGGGTTGPAADVSYSNFTIRMSPSHASTLSWTNNFASNVVGTQTTVRTGPLTIPALSFLGGASPNAFGPKIAFTPYNYTGGSLLIEIRRSTLSPTTSNNTDTDNTATATAGGRWLFNTSTDSATTGTIVTGAHIFTLEYTPGGTTLTGNVLLETIASDTMSLTPLSIELYDSMGNLVGSPVSATVSNTGAFSALLPAPNGTYTVKFRTQGSLRNAVAGVALAGGSLALPGSVLLRNGNADGNGEVGPADFSRVLANFGTEGAPAWIPSDLDRNGEVGPADFSIVLARFGEEDE